MHLHVCAYENPSCIQFTVFSAYWCGVSSALALGDVRRAGGGDPPALGGVLVRGVMGAGVQRAGGG